MIDPPIENYVEQHWDDFWNQVTSDVQQELASACNQHKPYNSAHEAYAVILEELDEFWDEVRRKRSLRSKTNMRKELIQVATTAIRAIHDLGLA